MKLSIGSDGIMHLVDAENYSLDVPTPKNDLGAQIQSRFQETGQLSESLIIHLCVVSIISFLSLWGLP